MPATALITICPEETASGDNFNANTMACAMWGQVLNRAKCVIARPDPTDKADLNTSF